MFSLRTPGVLALASVRAHGNMAANSGTEGAYNRGRFMRRFVDLQATNAQLALAMVKHESNVRVLNGDLQEQYQIMLSIDALITSVRKRFVAVTFAGCPPVFLAGLTEIGGEDPVVGAVHSGFMGISLNIVPNAIKEMRETKKVKVEETLEVVVGPGICGEHYEFGTALAYKLFAKYPAQIREIRGTDKCWLDLPGIIRIQAIDAGVSPKRISISSYCTWNDNAFLFDARRENMRPNDPENPIKSGIAMIGILEKTAA